MEKQQVLELIEEMQEKQREAELIDNHKLEIDCRLVIIKFYNMACKADPENKEKYLKIIDDLSTEAKVKMKEYNYNGDGTIPVNDKIVERQERTVNMVNKSK